MTRALTGRNNGASRRPGQVRAVYIIRKQLSLHECRVSNVRGLGILEPIDFVI